MKKLLRGQAGPVGSHIDKYQQGFAGINKLALFIKKLVPEMDPDAGHFVHDNFYGYFLII